MYVMGDTCLARGRHPRDLGEALKEYCLGRRVLYRTRRNLDGKRLQLHKFGAFIYEHGQEHGSLASDAKQVTYGK
jgi:hypothetical protein